MKQSHFSTAKLGEAIRSQRKRLGLSQSEIAELAKVSLNFVSQVESGKSTVQLSKLLKLLTELGMQFSLEFGKKSIEIKTGNRPHN